VVTQYGDAEVCLEEERKESPKKGNGREKDQAKPDLLGETRVEGPKGGNDAWLVEKWNVRSAHQVEIDGLESCHDQNTGEQAINIEAGMNETGQGPGQSGRQEGGEESEERIYPSHE